MRASAVVNCQRMVEAPALRRPAQAAPGPGGARPLQRPAVAEPPAQALPLRDAQLKLRHWCASCRFGRVVDLQLLHQAPRLGGREASGEGGRGMGVELVQHQHDLLGGVMDIDELLDPGGEAQPGPLLTD